MRGWLTATLRWTIALGVAVAAFVVLGPLVIDDLGDAVGFGSGEELPELEQEVGPPALRAGRAEATVDAGVSLGTIETLEGPLVSVGGPGVDTLLLGFEPLPADPACLVGVALEISLHKGVETSVHVLPARVDDLGALTDGHPLAADYLLTRTSPSKAHTTGAPGWLRFQVLGAYQLAARAAAPGSPAVLAVRLPPDADSDTLVTFATTDHRPARLRWAAVEGCDEAPSGDQPSPAAGAGSPQGAGG